MSQNEPTDSSIKHSTQRKLQDFSEDEIGVEQVAKIIESMIGNLEGAPFVIGLNSKWGTGKTEFLRMWSKQLETSNWKFVKFNSWENDFRQDPIACLLGELGNEFESEKTTSYLPSWSGVKEAAGYLFKNAVPGVIKHVTSGAVDIEGIGDAIGDVAKDAAEKAIESHTDLKNALTEFRSKLELLAKKVADETNHPLLIIVDELDRCRPNFALEMLETIKHLFEVKNVVFVLAYDGEQLACTTQAIYGNQFNGKGYLQRFFNIELRLPSNPIAFLRNEAERMGLIAWANATSRRDRACGTGADFISTLMALSLVHDFELRTIQRILTRASVVVATIGRERHIYPHVLAPLVALSAIDSTMLKQYFDGEIQHLQIIDRLWPIDKLQFLSWARVYDGEATLRWSYASSVFYFTYLDQLKFHESTDFEIFSVPILKSRGKTSGFDDVSQAFNLIPRQHGFAYWNGRVLDTLGRYLDGTAQFSS